MMGKEDRRREIQWGSMIPLVGGSSLGCARATFSLPQYHLSYSPFAGNEVHLDRYWQQYEIPWYYLDKVDPYLPFPDYKQGEMDFITSVCPCAGLSMLNVSKGGENQRGSDAVQNDWMLKSASFILSTVRPKVLWGENAPALYQGASILVDKLVTIGKDHGYSFSMVKTDSLLHGLPQRRVRTFYFFWKSVTVPMLAWKSTPAPRLIDYLAEIPQEATLQDVYVHEGVASQRYRPYQFVLEREGLTHKQFSHKFGRGTVAKYLEKYDLIDECITWLTKYYPNETFATRGGNCKTHIDMLEHIKNKLSQGLGYWDDSLKFMGEYFSAVISKNVAFAVHPTEDRFFNVRELLHLMGMPHDFEMENPKKNINHICQNVPVNTAEDWAEEVVKFCRGEADMTNYTFLRQDNTNQTITDSLPPQENVSPRTPHKRQAQDYSMTPKKSKLFVEPKLYFDEPSLAQLNLDLYNYHHKGIKTAQMEMKTLPTRKSLARVLENHESLQPRVENRAQQKFSQNFVKFNAEILKEDKGDIFQCGLCHFRTTDKIDLNDHWLTNCSLQTKERENDTKYQCSGCGATTLTTDDMKTHWQFDCSAYVKQEFKDVPETNLMKGTYIAKQELSHYQRQRRV